MLRGLFFIFGLFDGADDGVIVKNIKLVALSLYWYLNDFCVLLDDYGSESSSGVRKLIDEISEKINITLIETNVPKQLKKLDNNYDEQSYYHAMCWADKESVKNFLPMTHNEDINKFLAQYRKYEKRWKLRNTINKKFPFLSNVKFSKYLPR